MSKPKPLRYGAYYHIYNRGNNRENVFFEEKNYPYFLKLYAKYAEPVAETYAYCLLRNHFHFLVRIKTVEEQQAEFETQKQEAPSGFENPTGLGSEATFKPRNPGQQFGNLFNAYTKAMNKAYQRTGGLLEKPFKRVEVTSDAYFTWLIIYIHQNPQEHNLINDFRTWPYSSYQALISRQPTRLKREVVLGWLDGVELLKKSHIQPVPKAKIRPLLLEDFD